MDSLILNNMAINNEDNSTITRILQSVELFKNLDPQNNAELIKRIVLEYYPKQHFLFHEGDAANDFYIIKRGMVRIFHEGPTPDEDKDVTMLGDGDFFGEMALISEKPRNSSALTTEESEIFRLSKADFIQFVSSDPTLASKISSEFLSRVKSNIRSQNQ
jgi:CRP-like cAMP-binding protein